ncbi:lysophospholipase catalytic domain-containing protein [Mrakia frigida]|uniref:lysophospholipase catalytic domain-containing protein n=1 Tax=Mrakia frigida TaxID=29902 RepID=UPI003FCC1693
MLLLPLLLSLLPASVLAAPSSLLPSTRSDIKRLSNDQRRELAATIATQLFARDPNDQVNPEIIKAEVLVFLQDLEQQGANTGGIQKRLFGFGDDDPNEGVLTGYAPARVACPEGQTFIRVAENISTVENDHIQTRLNPDRFLNYLSGLNISPSTLNLNLNSSSPTSSSPNVGLAFSGGGYRAQISGGGGLWGTDFRNEEAVAAGTGGIGQVATYMTGLSGGSWLVGSYMANQNRTIPDLAQNVWNLSDNLVIPDVSGFLGTTQYFADLVSEVASKGAEGFATQITDYWGLALSAHLFPNQYGPQETPNLTLSDLAGLPAADVPYPIIIAAEREPDTIVVSTNATIWEFTYNEFGTWGFGGGAGGTDSPIIGAFMNTTFLGTDMNGGIPSSTEEEKCYIGFDNLGFVVGTSSTLFNAAYVMIVSSNSSDSGILASTIEAVLEAIGEAGNDVATYPNPFYGFANESNPLAQSETLTLVDAGETNQNIPFEPLLIPARNVDAIIAFDASADTTYSWPNGTAISTTYQRFNALAISLDHPPFMPAVPSANTFVNTGLNQHPVFFGCSADARPNTTAPLIIYVPNYPWSTASNTSTFQLEYETSQALDIVYNGGRTLTLNNTISNWSTCLACALADRAVARGGSERSQTCRDCFGQWCWDGAIDDSTPTTEYEPTVGSVPSFLANLGATATAASTPTPSASTAADGASSGAGRGFVAAWGVGLFGLVLGAALQF